MNWGIQNNLKVLAKPKEKASCPLCNEKVLAKCGKIKIWHWAHKSNFECDSFGEPETEWHINWKNEFPKEQQELTIGKHRADIRTKSRWIIELQNSNISPEKIIERENYYKRMIWLLNGETLCKGLNLRKKNKIITFRWKSPPKSWWYAKKEVYIDISINYNIENNKNPIFLIKKIYPKIPCGGWGEIITKEEFLKRVDNGH